MKLKLRFLKLFSISLVLVLATSTAFAQISEGGTPPSFVRKAQQQTVTQSAQQQLYVAPINFSVAQLLQEDAINESYGHPPRLGQIINTQLSMSDGYWTTLDNGQQIWQLNIQAPGAIALMLYYDEFYIPKGGKLFIYNKDRTHILGAYTENTNLWGKEFATEFVAGDELTLEYVAPTADLADAAAKKTITGETAPSTAMDFPRIKISGISYGYNHLEVFQRAEGMPLYSFGEAGSCYVNVNCSPEGDNWQDQKKGIVRIIMQVGGGTGSCSGSLINNTAQDLAPYLLSAYHCVDGLPDASYNTMLFYFNYESPGCESGTTEPVHKTMVGADPKVLLPMAKGQTDGALLLLRNTVPAEYNPYWNGWDRSSRTPARGAAIHHPKGDIKKISTYSNPPQITQYSSVSAPNGHFLLAFSPTENGYSTVESGSSGCPLFNEAGLIVGNLSGGDAGCNKPYGSALFGRLWYHWDQGPADSQMKNYLDPINTGVTSLQGRYASDMLMANFTMDKSSVYASEAIQFIDRSYGAESYSWTFEGGTPATSTDKNPKVTYNTPGHYKVELTINKGTNKEKVAEPAYIDCVQKKASCPEYVTVGTETNKAQFPLGLMHKHVMSSAIYTKEELNNKAGTITELAWYTDNYLGTYRTMSIYLKEVDETTQTAATWEEEIAGATLVYNSLTAFYNYSYWNKFVLDSPFNYSGTKSLKVLVYTRAAVSATNSSGCRYSTAAGKHMEWIFAEQVNSELKGSVTGNRPNIKVTFDEGCQATAPATAFSVQIQENFESLAFPPRGWKVETKGEVGTIWLRGFISNLPSTVIDPTIGSNSVAITPNTKPCDSWLISKPYDLPANSKIEFYAGYDPRSLSKAALNLYVSTDNGQTWGAAKWTTGTTDNDGDWYWRKQTVDLSAYANKEVRFAWQYKGAGGNLAGIDGVKIYSTDNVIYINEGDAVAFVDKTTGPPMQWKWTTTGGNPAASNAQNVNVQYNTAGEYNVTLFTKNNLGEKEITIQKAVKVNVKKPIPAIITNVPNQFPGYNKFISIADPQIAFGDRGLNKPTSWTWNFTGGTPASSTRQTPDIVTYPKQAASYDVGLKVTNSAGSAEKNNSDYVVVGDKGWIWNIQEGETSDNVYSTGSGYLTGNNTTGGDGIWCLAELYDINAPAEITKLKIAFHTDATSKGYIAIWIASKELVDGFNGEGWLRHLLMDEIQVPVSAISTTGYTEIELPRPVATPGAFYVLIGNLGALATCENVAIKSSPLRWPGSTGSGKLKIESLAINGNKFTATNLIDGYGFDLSLNMAAEIHYTTLGQLSPTDFHLPNESAEKNITVESNFNWEVTSAYPWLHINGSDTLKGSDNASFTISCDENFGGARIGYAVFEGGGYRQTVTVRQAGANNAIALSANISTESKNNVDLSWMTKTGQSMEDIFDDFEGHAVFTSNSPGTVGWSYIDNDWSYSTQLIGGDFPDAVAKRAFVIYDRDKVNNGAGIAHGNFWNDLLRPLNSGTQVLANIEGSVRTDDWIISPPLNFVKNFTFSFWAKAAGGSANVRILASTTGKEQEAFNMLLHESETITIGGEEWRLYEFAVPQNARYVALNSLGGTQYMTMFDDMFIGVGQRPASARAYVGEISPSCSVASHSVLHNESEGQSVIVTTTEAPLQKIKRNISFTSKNSTANSSIAPKAAVQSSPDYGKIGSKIHWCNEILDSYTMIGFSDGGTYKDGTSLMAGAKWDASELAVYDDLAISKVKLFLGASNRIMLRIFQDGTEIYSQEIPAYAEKDYTEIVLAKPVKIDVTKSLIIAFDADHKAGQMPAALDHGNPTKKGKGDLVWIEEDKKWYPLTDIAGSGYTGNWYIVATLGSKDGKYYKLFRGDQEIASTTDLNYTDKNLSVKGEVCYTVHTFYDDGALSTPSNRACVFVTGLAQDITFDPISDKYAGTPDFALHAVASSGLPVRFESSNPSVATIVNGNYVHLLSAGKVTITAYQDGNDQYAPATPVAQNITVNAPMLDPSQLIVTEAISPNGDGLNDYFTIQGIELFPDNELTIFDESGRVHYKMNGYNNTFDGIANQGKYKGQRLLAGTYYYILKVNGKAEKRSFLVIKY